MPDFLPNGSQYFSGSSWHLAQRHKSPPEQVMYACLVAQSFPTLGDSVGSRPPGSSVQEISQARMLEWVAVSSSRGSSRPRGQTCISCVARIAGGFLSRWAVGDSHIASQFSATLLSAFLSLNFQVCFPFFSSFEIFQTSHSWSFTLDAVPLSAQVFNSVRTSSAFSRFFH